LSLNPSMPIYTACAQTSGLSPAIIISGLYGTKQIDGSGPDVTVTNNGGTVLRTETSTWSGGNITISLSADIAESVTTVFKFTLVNSYSAQAQLTDTLIEIVGLGITDSNLDESGGFLEIIQAEWTQADARQSTPYRKFTLRPVVVVKSCVHPSYPHVPTCSPRMTHTCCEIMKNGELGHHFQAF